MSATDDVEAPFVKKGLTKKNRYSLSGGSFAQALAASSHEMVRAQSPGGPDEMQLTTELIFAASRGEVDTMINLLEAKGANPNLGDYDHRTAVHIAAAEGQVEAVKILISHGANVNVIDRWNVTPLDSAAVAGQTAAAKALLAQGASYGEGHSTALKLIQATNNEDIKQVKNILDIGFSPNVGDYDNRTPLHIAVATGNMELVKLLVGEGANVHALDRFGGTPMTDAEQHAPRFGEAPLRDWLLDHGGRVVKEEDRDDSFLDFGVLITFLQILFMLLFGLFVEYGEGPDGLNAQASAEEVSGKYSQFQDVHVMMFVGFGMLMLFLKKYALSAMTYTFLITVVVIQWHILVHGFWHSVFGGHFGKIHVNLTDFILSDFASACVLITFGAILGKVNKPSQLVVIALLEIVFFSANEMIGVELLGISDIGGSMVVHIYGAYFGLAVSKVLTTEESFTHEDNGANYMSDTLAMVGSVFLWMFWPSFNSALASADDQERTVINTILSLTASGMAAFAASYFLRGEKKFDMVDLQNASIAGGVAVGTAANMMLGPVYAQVIGFVAGWLSVFGYVHIQPFLERTFGIYDTCGVHNLHGLPGVLAGIFGIIFTAAATPENYNSQSNFDAVFGSDGASAGNQAAFMAITLVSCIVAGLFTGFVAKLLCGKNQPTPYSDNSHFMHIKL
jgi:ammonium transporter Rh